MLTGSSTTRARWTLALAVTGSAVLLTATVLYLRHETGSASAPPAPTALPGPWEPPSPVPVTTAAPPSVPTSATRPTSPSSSPSRSVSPSSRRPPTTEPTRAPTLGPNLSLTAGADADGTSKVQGTSFNDVRDGDRATFWSPDGSTTGRISVKRDVPLTVGRVIIREAAGTTGTIQSWRLVNHDTGDVLATGSRARCGHVPTGDPSQDRLCDPSR